MEFLLPSNIVPDGRWKLCYLGADPSISAHEGEKILTSTKLSDCVFSWILFYSGKAVKALSKGLFIMPIAGVYPQCSE